MRLGEVISRSTGIGVLCYTEGSVAEQCQTRSLNNVVVMKLIVHLRIFRVLVSILWGYRFLFPPEPALPPYCVPTIKI